MNKVLQYLPLENLWRVVYMSDIYSDVIHKWHELKNNYLVIVENE
jgi:hypothetical protein